MGPSQSSLYIYATGFIMKLKQPWEVDELLLMLWWMLLSHCCVENVVSLIKILNKCCEILLNDRNEKRVFFCLFILSRNENSKDQDQSVLIKKFI